MPRPARLRLLAAGHRVREAKLHERRPHTRTGLVAQHRTGNVAREKPPHHLEVTQRGLGPSLLEKARMARREGRPVPGPQRRQSPLVELMTLRNLAPEAPGVLIEGQHPADDESHALS